MKLVLLIALLISGAIPLVQCDKPNPSELVEMGDKYLYGDDSVEVDSTKAIECYQKAADMGNALGQFKTSLCYMHGLGISRDTTKALDYMQKAIKQGLPIAEWTLGTWYCYGRGVGKSYLAGLQLITSAAQKGDRWAQRTLGDLYSEGYATEESYAQAAKWYQLAAEQGDSAAQYMIGSLYYVGDGVVHDEHKAYEWFQKAAAGGDRRASNALNGRCVFNDISDWEVSDTGFLSYNWGSNVELVASSVHLSNGNPSHAFKGSALADEVLNYTADLPIYLGCTLDSASMTFFRKKLATASLWFPLYTGETHETFVDLKKNLLRLLGDPVKNNADANLGFYLISWKGKYTQVILGKGSSEMPESVILLFMSNQVMNEIENERKRVELRTTR